MKKLIFLILLVTSSVFASSAGGNVPISGAGGGTVTPGTAGQIFQTNNTPATSWVSLSGDLTIAVGGAVTLKSGITLSGHPTIEGVTSTGATGTGKFVFDTSPTLITPVLGTPASGTLTNCTGLPGTSITGGTQHSVATYGASGLLAAGIAPGSNGNVLTSNGTDWTSAAAAGGATILTSYLTSDKDCANNTLSDSGLTVTVTGGKFYSVEAQILCDTNASISPGVQLELEGDGTSSVTDMRIIWTVEQSNTVNQRQKGAYITNLTTAFGDSGNARDQDPIVTLYGYVNINVGGAIKIQVAQNTTDGSNHTKFRKGSWLRLIPMN